MTPGKLRRLLDQKESPTLEFKCAWYKIDDPNPETKKRQREELIKDMLSLTNYDTNGISVLSGDELSFSLDWLWEQEYCGSYTDQFGKFSEIFSVHNHPGAETMNQTALTVAFYFGPGDSPPYRLNKKYVVKNWTDETHLRPLLDEIAAEMNYLSGYGILSMAVKEAGLNFTVARCACPVEPACTHCQQAEIMIN